MESDKLMMHGQQVSSRPRPNGGRKPCPRLENSRNRLLKKEKNVLNPINKVHGTHSKLTVVGYCLGIHDDHCLDFNPSLKASASCQIIETKPKVGF
jgi:hypothetical protein